MTPDHMAPRFDLNQRHPSIYQAMAAVTARTRHTIDSAIAELVKIRASQLNGCAYCIDMHTKAARAAGETEQRLYALSAWKESPFFSEAERAALDLCEAITLIHDGGVPDRVYDEAANHFDPDELAGLVWTIAIINTWNRVAVTSRVTPEQDEATAAR